MTEVLNGLAIELRSIFANFYRRDIVSLTFIKQRDTQSHLVGIRIEQPAQWSDASFADMNTALLSLPHNGYIVYGANRITLKQKLLHIEHVGIRT